MKTTKNIFLKAILGSAVFLIFSLTSVMGSTNHFGGTITGTSGCEFPCYSQLTIKMDFLVYTSYGSYNESTKVGEYNSGNIENMQTACMLNNTLVNQQTLANAVRPGMWGTYFQSF